MGRRGRGKGKGDPRPEEEPGDHRLNPKGGAAPPRQHQVQQQQQQRQLLLQQQLLQQQQQQRQLVEQQPWLPQSLQNAPQRPLIEPSGGPFLDLPTPLDDEVDQAVPLTIHPITPLGIANTPPPLPKLPAFLFTPLPPTAEPAEAPGAGPSSGNSDDAKEPPAAPEDGDWTPVNDRQSKKDRRNFFHNEGKEHAFHLYTAKPAAESCEVGEHVTVLVEEVHFGNPRVRVMQPDPAPMPTMLKWSAEKFGEFRIECAQISFGSDYRVWCAVGVQANRLLYAMKRSKVESAQAVVVAPPALAEPDEDIDLTYGPCIQGIQLVP